MAWPNFLYNQTQLATICRHWPVHISEFHAQNTLYGHHLVLKHYAGIPPEEPLPWAIEHVINYNKPEPYFAHVQSCLPIILAISEAQAGLMRSKTNTRVEAIGSPFFYMKELFQKRHPGLLTAGGERRGTIVFPSKSTKNEDWDYDSAAFASQLAALPDEFHPVAVSIFWRDFERGGHREFERAGMQVVSAGNQEDPDFLFRYLDLCRQFKYSCANHLATSFCYSVLSGCHFFYWSGGAVSVTKDGRVRTYDSDPTLDLPGKRECAAAGPFPPTDNVGAQRGLAEHFAGHDSIRPPGFFRELFEDGHRIMRSRIPVSVLLDPVERLDRLAQWNPRAIDSDGWAQERAGFIIPHLEGQAGVRLRIEVPPRPDPHWEAEWSMVADDLPTFSFRVKAGRQVFEISSPGPNGRRSVWIHSSDPVPLSREARVRSFRVTGIEWIESLAAEPSPWGIRRSAGGEASAIEPPASNRSDKDSFPISDLSDWQLEEVDERGWVFGGCAITVPPRSDQAGVRVKISLGNECRLEWKGQMTVRFADGDGREAVTEISRGSWYLEVPVLPDGRSRNVQLTFRPSPGHSSDGSGVLPDFRLRQITWRNGVSITEPDGPEQMRFHRMEDLKRLASQARTRPRPRWLRFLTGWIWNRR